MAHSICRRWLVPPTPQFAFEIGSGKKGWNAPTLGAGLIIGKGAPETKVTGRNGPNPKNTFGWCAAAVTNRFPIPMH